MLSPRAQRERLAQAAAAECCSVMFGAPYEYLVLYQVSYVPGTRYLVALNTSPQMTLLASTIVDDVAVVVYLDE